MRFCYLQGPYKHGIEERCNSLAIGGLRPHIFQINFDFHLATLSSQESGSDPQLIFTLETLNVENTLFMCEIVLKNDVFY